MTAWQGHTPFAMYLVELLKPSTIVELGTHYGDSYCAFCQAVSDLQLPTLTYAVDTWRGDPQAGYYGEEVLADLLRHHDPLYSGFSELIRSTFDDALPRFADRSIDLLHIDGCHLYDDVRHDFDQWLPKMSDRGVVLLHDTVRTLDDFGVWRLLEELRDTYPTLEFAHSNGLAVVLVGNRPAPEVMALTELTGPHLAGFRSFFATIGEGVRRVGEVRRGIERAESIAADAAHKQAEIDGLRGELDVSRRELDDRLAQVELMQRSRLVRLGRWVRRQPIT